MRFNRLTVALAACTTALIVGCADLPKFGKDKKAEFARATEDDPAAELVCIWQPAHGRGLNGMPSRGVAGQLLFFTRSNPSPVVVEGDLRIYLFDNRGPQEEWTRPIHIFDIPAEQLGAHRQNSSFGSGYQIFVPYVREGNEQATCSLQVRFTPKKGPVIYSQLSSVALPGTTPTDGAEPNGSGMASQASYLQEGTEIAEPAKGPRLTVKSISPRDLFAPPAAAKAAATARSIPSAEGTTPDDSEARIERLEQMVSQLLEQNQRQSAALEQARRRAKGGDPTPADEASATAAAPTPSEASRGTSQASGGQSPQPATPRPHPLRDAAGG